jgi:hypothetical protein
MDSLRVLLFTPRLKGTWALLFVQQTETPVNDTDKGDTVGDEHPSHLKNILSIVKFFFFKLHYLGPFLYKHKLFS